SPSRSSGPPRATYLSGHGEVRASGDQRSPEAPRGVSLSFGSRYDYFEWAAPRAARRGPGEAPSRANKEQGKDSMATIALIGAGSVVWARRLMMDILSFPELAGSTLSLMDADPVRLETSRMTVERLVSQIGARATVRATLDRREAVRGA